MRTALRITVLFAVVGALFSPSPTLAATDACDTNYVEAYKVEMKTDRKVYALGDTAIVTMKVTELTTGTPIADAEAYAGAIVGDRFSFRAGRTNDAGIAKLRLSLDREYIRPGWADLRGMARHYYDEGEAGCAGLGLYGYEEIRRAFRVTR